MFVDTPGRTTSSAQTPSFKLQTTKNDVKTAVSVQKVILKIEGISMKSENQI